MCNATEGPLHSTPTSVTSREVSGVQGWINHPSAPCDCGRVGESRLVRISDGGPSDGRRGTGVAHVYCRSCGHVGRRYIDSVTRRRGSCTRASPDSLNPYCHVARPRADRHTDDGSRVAALAQRARPARRAFVNGESRLRNPACETWRDRHNYESEQSQRKAHPTASHPKGTRADRCVLRGGDTHSSPGGPLRR